MDDAGQASGWSERTTADVSSLMVELGRVAKAVPFYGAATDTAQTLAERTCRALHADLARAGPLELEVCEDGFQVAGIGGSFGSDHLAKAAAGLTRSGVQRIRFTEVVSAGSLMRFIESLDALEDGERPPSQLGIEVDGELCLTLGSDPESETLVTEATLASLGSSLLRGSVDAEASSPEKPTIEQDPLRAPASGPEAARLLGCLRDLDRCSEDPIYIQLAARVADAARPLCDDGIHEEAIRAMFVLADHVMGDGGRSAVQARVARGTLLELAMGDRLGELLDRACSSDTRTSVRAAQTLLIVGEQAVPALVERLEIEIDTARGGQLTGLLIALGDAAVPTLTGSMGSGNGVRARLGIRLAGELQCPELAQPLRDLLCAKDGPLQKDAGRALVEMGNSAALRALLEALESKHDRTAEVAAAALGTLGAPRGRPALVRRLERATQDRSWDLCREILQAIGQFELGDRATTRALVAWVQRGGPPWRRPDLELKLEAVTTLGQLGGPESTEALREIAGMRLSSRLRERAQRILDRRGDGRRSSR